MQSSILTEKVTIAHSLCYLSLNNNMDKLEMEWRSYNKKMRRINLHECQLDTLDDYRRHLNGTQKRTQEFKDLEKKDTKYRRTPKNYVSSIERTSNENPTAKRKPLQYTGSLVKGISTMHKSNAVPIINEQEMKDHANMRR